CLILKDDEGKTMKAIRTLPGLVVVSLLILLHNTPALADVTNIIGGIICGSSDCSPNGAIPVLQGKKTTLLVDGQDVNFADKNNVDVRGHRSFTRHYREFFTFPQ